MRAYSKISADWWDYTTLDREILDAASRITIENLKSFERPGFKINLFDTYQEFYCAEALEYIGEFELVINNPIYTIYKGMVSKK